MWVENMVCRVGGRVANGPVWWGGVWKNSGEGGDDFAGVGGCGGARIVRYAWLAA